MVSSRYRSSPSRRRALALPALLSLALCAAARAQSEDAGLDIAPAQNLGTLDALGPLTRPTPALEKLCYVRASGGEAMVTKVMCELGEKRLVKLPSGELSVVTRRHTRPCDRPFRSMTREAIARSMEQEGFGRFKFAPSGYYLFAYDCSEGFYRHTRSILRTLLPGVVRELRDWGLEPARPETPLVVVIFPSRAAFDAYEKMPASVAAYYNGLDNRIILYEDQRLWNAAPEYALRQAAYTIAHEGVHQILANTGIQQRLSGWPQWISEGLPEYFCPLTVSSRVVKQNGDELPERTLEWQRAGMVNDLRMYDLLRTRARDGRLVRAAIGAKELTSYGYAVSWGLVHYLSNRRSDAFAAYLKDLGEARPLQPAVESFAGGPDPLFVKHFGDDYAGIESEVQRHLTSRRIQNEYRDPIENQTHYVVKRIYKKGRTFHTSVVLTLSPAAAREWKEQEEARMDEMGEEAQFYTIMCDTRKEAEYQIAKLRR